MADKIQKPCRVCNKMFTPCTDCEADKTMFRWRKFTCSIDCAKEYFAKIEESRRSTAEPEVNQAVHHDSLSTSYVSDAANVETVKPKRVRKKNVELRQL